MRAASRPPLIRRLRPGHWMAFDVLGVLPGALLAMGVMAPHPARSQVPLLLLTAVVFSTPVLWRRRRPLVALMLPVVALAPVALTAPRLVTLLLTPIALAVYSVAATRRTGAAVGALGLGVVAALVAVPAAIPHLGGVLAYALLLTTVWTVGYAVGLHRRYTEYVLHHQAALADAQLVQARQEIAEQRLRIAREMHDVLAHTISVINVQAGYGHFVIDSEPEAARGALDAIRTTSRDAMGELRGLLGVLRAGGPPEEHLRPAPGLADVDALLARVGEAGVRVDLRVTGEPHGLSPGVDVSAYRILQEALTNVVKHAAGHTARAALHYRDDELVIDVTDDGPTTTTAVREGHGLAGMRERAHLHGGRLTAAPLPGRGFQVTASLPIMHGAA